jgi:hypothetical protein
MTVNDLPVGNAPKALEFPHFPSRTHAVVWRNWGLVPGDRLEKTLKAQLCQIEEIAESMGLRKDESSVPKWLERGYVTIIRRNWHLLPYEQILELLGWTAEEMAFTLKEDDFLWHKLGSLKPAAEPVYYTQPTAEGKQRAAEIKETVRKYFRETEPGEKPFAFLERYGRRGDVIPAPAPGMRLSYSYSAVYGDPLLNDKLDPYPDGLLEDYAAAGVNAVWLQGTLYTLIPWFGETQYSAGWQKRLENLRKLCARAKKFGIKVYLYINEPRAMPPEFYDTRPDWKGVKAHNGLSYAMCVGKGAMLDALKEGMARLFREVPELGGVFTITMSENLTHCHSRGQRPDCPVCATISPAKLVADVNRAIAAGVHSVSQEADVIAWTWAWDPEWDERAVELLPNDVKLMCVSETEVETDAQGVKGSVIDYSMSKAGPGPAAKRLWKKARERGLSPVAKVQLNNTWEFSAAHYIPVPGLVERHLKNLAAEGVKDFMITWTLGGWPGGNFELLKMSKEALAAEKFGDKAAPHILKAWDLFGKAFEEFPFHGTAALYTGPQNFGPADLLYERPTGYHATMVGFPYDDLTAWRGNHYPEDIFEDQFRKISEGWADGMKILEDTRKLIPADKMESLTDLISAAETVYCHFRSSYLQIRFVRLRGTDRKDEILRVLEEEAEIARRLHAAAAKDSRIGFEASNHYYYTLNDLKEKVLNCEFLKERLSKK